MSAATFFHDCGILPSADDVRQRIRQDLAAVLEGIRRAGRRTDAVVMSGSLGRGEGTVVLQDGIPRLLSDYDICVFSDEVPDHTAYWRVAEELTGRLWAPRASIGAVPTSALHTVPPSVWGYDLKYGTTVLEGQPAILDRIPPYRPGDVPDWEGLKLIFNYSAYLLAALPAGAPAAVQAAETAEIRLSAIRAAYRLGDALTILEGRYHPCLAVRQGCLPELTSFRQLPGSARELVLWGCEEKLQPRHFWTFDVEGTLARLLPLIETVLTRYLRRFLHTDEDALPALLAAYRHRFPARRPSWSPWRGLRARLWGASPSVLLRPAAPVERYHHILSLVPLVLLSPPGVLHRPDYLEAACQLLGMDSAVAGTIRTDSLWQQVRERTARLWVEYCSRG